MLRAGARVIRADLLGRALPAFLTGLVIAVAAGALLVTLHLRSALDDPFRAISRATAAPDVVVAGPAAEAARIAARPGVAHADPPRRVVDVPAAFGATEGRLTLVEQAPPGGLDRPLRLRGRAAARPGEVMLDDGLAGLHRLGPGSVVTAGGVRLRVVGTGITTQPRAGGWAVAGQIRSLARHAGSEVAIPLRLRDPSASRAFVAAAERDAGAVVRLAEWQQARADYTEDSRRMLAILQASTLLALLAAGFTLATSIGGRVIGERRRIGLLRAVGMTPRGVTSVLVAHYLVLAAIAAPVGLAAGYALAPGLLDRAAIAVGAPPAGPPAPAAIAGALAAVLALVALATAVPAWRAGRVAPMEALALGRGAPAERASRLARLARRLRLPVVVALGARDAFARPARAALTVASLALAAVLVVCAMGFEATMDRLASDPSLRAQPWDLRIAASAMAPAEVDALLREHGDVAAAARVYRPRLVTGDGRAQLAARAIDPVKGDVTAFPFAIREGRGAVAAGELTLGRGGLEHLGVAVGDRIALRAGGDPFVARVVGRHVEPDDGGRVAVLAAAALPPGFRDLDDPAWVANARPGADAAAVQAELLRAGAGRLSVERPVESLRAEAADMRPIVYGVSVLLLVIAAANLLTTLLLGIRERRRDIAVLGAVGATPGQVGATVVAGAALLTLLAALAGLPLGAIVFRAMITVTDPADGPDVSALPPAWWVVLAVPVALAATAVLASLAARRAAAVSVAGALRAE